MDNLSGFLAKFRRVLETTQDEQDAVIATISEVSKISLTSKDVVIKNGNITIEGSPALKSKIFISKDKILAALQEKFPKKFRSIR